jgi:hypothetical protein
MKTVFNCTQVSADTIEVYRAADDIVIELDVGVDFDTSVLISVEDAKKLRKSLKKLIREAEENYVSVC